MLKVENVSKGIGNITLKSIDINLEEGFILGLIGPNGSGKTTLIKMIMGLLNPDEGSIRIFGKDIKENPIDIKNDIGFVYDSLNFYPHLKVKDFKKIMKLFYENFEEEKFDNCIERFDINTKSYIKNLSKGESVKLMLANALSHNAKLLILDEPTAGLDPIIRKEVLDYLQEFIEDGKKSVIISTHNTNELDRIADYITFINKGNQIFTLDKETLLEKYKIIKCKSEELEDIKDIIVGIRHHKYYSEALVELNNIEDINLLKLDNISNPNIEDIMCYYEGGISNA